MNFECHVTVHVSQAVEAKKIAEDARWKTSEILNDPLLGDRPFFYLTKHSQDYIEIFKQMSAVSACLEAAGIQVLREKIELIMYDTKLKT